jgi:SPP1 gp7 family putative phage head morphogenesis protein
MNIKKKDYWKKRALIAVEAGEKDALSIINETSNAWKNASIAIKSELNAFYGRYAKDNKISFLEAKKRLNPKELKFFREQHSLYLDEIKRLGPKAFTADYETYIKDLSAKAAVTRMDELSANLRYQYEKTACTVNTAMGNSLSESYKSRYYSSMYDFQKGTGLGFDFFNPDTKTVEKAISQKWLGENYSDRIWKDKNKQLPIIEREVQQGIASGLPSSQISKRIEKRCDVSASNAKRLAATEIAHIREEANADAYEEAGIESYEFDATLDGKTSEMCAMLDSSVFKMKNKQVGVNFPPMHPWCRSTTLPYFDDIVEDGVFRAGRGPDGKTKLFDASLTYEEWLNQYTKPSDTKKPPKEDKAKEEKEDKLKKSERKVEILQMANKRHNERTSEQAKEIRNRFATRRERTGIFSEVINDIKKNQIDYLDVKKLNNTLSKENIIERLSGGDMTKGSCSSLAIAYAGNRAGFDVLDFRDGKSRLFFAINKNIKNISKTGGYVASDYNGFTVAKELLSKVEEGKEYYFTSGKHAAIVRRSRNEYQYLELQSKYKENNVFKRLDINSLKNRFKTKASHSIYKMKVKQEDSIIDIEKLKDSVLFRKLLGYINTDQLKQKKGILGSTK